MRIGIYYDDPETVPEDQLRFAVGVVIAQSKKILINIFLTKSPFNSLTLNKT
jgi:DNA gyrase inhibitor GyrI